MYTVVEVWRGIADRARSFVDEDKARRYFRSARRRHNLLEDDVRLFEGTVSRVLVGRRMRSRSRRLDQVLG